MSHLNVHTRAFTGLERFFYAAIFPGMKCENGNPASCLQAERKIMQERIQRAEFVVHGDSQGLENAAHGVIVSSGASNGGGKLCRCRYRSLQDGLRDAAGAGLVGVLE